MNKDGREKIRTLNEAKLYMYKAGFDCILEYLHRDLDLYSCDVEESMVSVRTENMEWFQKWISEKITEHDKLSTGNKSKWHIF